MVVPKDSEAQNWKLISNYSSGKTCIVTGQALTAEPPNGGYHDVQDWFYQRYGTFWDDALKHRMSSPRDWSGYEVLRFDVFSTTAPFILGMKLIDAGIPPRIQAASQGIRSGLILFEIPPGQEMTCEVPLAEIAKLCELDLSKIQGFNMRFNGYKGETELFLDNIRIVGKDAMGSDAKFPLLKPYEAPKPFARKVMYFEPTKSDEGNMRRVEGKVERIDPKQVYLGKGAYGCSQGHLGGSGLTYYQNTVRGVAVYDDNRILFIFKGDVPNGARKTSNFASETNGCLGMATFDGGKTWGGVTGGEAVATNFFDWFWRGSMSSDSSGNLYFSGTQNCTSYHEHYDVFFRRLKFAGNGWVEDRFSIMDQNMQKCPCWSRSLKIKSGRIWSAWNDGFGGLMSRFSDDDGYTWDPCKDAAETKIPRPFYTPNLDELKKPEAQRRKPPKEVLIWPGTPILFAEGCNAKNGGFLAPFGESVVAFTTEGFWQTYEGNAWGKVNDKPKWKSEDLGFGSETVIGEKKLFFARSAFHDDSGTERLAPLEAVCLKDDASGWNDVEVLEEGNVANSILTASGANVYCFYSKKSGDKYELRYRRWKAGKWEPSVLVSTENVRINQIAAPQISRPNFVAVLWDQSTTSAKGQPTWIKFAKFPNE